MDLRLLLFPVALTFSLFVDCLVFKSLWLDSASISKACKKDEGSFKTNALSECVRYCRLEKCNGLSALLQNGSCHCVDDTCVPNEVEGRPTNLVGDAIIMTYSWTSIYQEKCYGSVGDRYASFQAPDTGKIKSIKLVHVSGGVSCFAGRDPSIWGCSLPSSFSSSQFLAVVTESSTNEPIFPSNFDGKYDYPGGDLFATKEIILSADQPYQVKAGDEFRIWYGRDLLNELEDANDQHIMHCVKVFIKYC